MSSKKVENSEAVYTVERILDRRTVGGVVEYMIKWAGYDESHNSWIDESDIIGCDSLIGEYWTDWRNKRSSKSKQNQNKPNVAEPPAEPPKKPPVLTGLDKGLKPKKILGVRDENGRLDYLVQWDDDTTELVRCNDLNEQYSQLVILFYEERQNLQIAQQAGEEKTPDV